MLYIVSTRFFCLGRIILKIFTLFYSKSLQVSIFVVSLHYQIKTKKL